MSGRFQSAWSWQNWSWQDRSAAPTAIICSALAEIDDAGDLDAQVLARHDAVHEAVLEQKLAGLKAFGQLQPDGVPDGALAGEANQGAGLGEGDVPLQGKAGSHASHGR